MNAGQPSRFRRWSLLLWKAAFATLLSAVVVMPVRLHAAEHLVQPGDDPQAVLDAAARST